MDKRMVDFIRVLRAAGVRISLAESMDAMRGVEVVGVGDRELFRSAMKTTLVKENRDQGTFEYFFPLYFGSGRPPMQNIPSQLTPDQQATLQEALQALMGDMQALRDLMNQLMQGQPFSRDQLQDAADQTGMSQADNMQMRPWMERRMQQQLSLKQIQDMIEQLMQMLAQMGMSAEAMQQIREMMQQNADGLTDQVSNFTGASLAERMANREPEPRPDLLDVPFTRLSDEQVDAIRDEIRRLAARLRSRAALRQRRAKSGTLDTRRMMRANMRYDAVPIELRFRTKHVKPALVLICDISTSMRYCAEFLLTLIYELQDQVARTDSFVFIGDLVDISMVFTENEPQTAVGKVLNENRPGYYNTDLGHSLDTFKRDFMGRMSSKTTVIILGDGRNNYNDPRIDIAQEMMRRGRRLIWFNPEPQSQWGTGDSDMHLYAQAATAVFRVSNLRELAAAVDKILVDG
jgi:hypothetical protein